MKRLSLAVGVAAAVSAAAGVWMQASAAQAAGQVTYTTKSASVNTHPGNAKPGDRWVVYADLFDANGNKVGDASAQCAEVQGTGTVEIINCLRTLRTGQGKITFAQVEERDGDKREITREPLLGGSGKYSGVTGEITVEAAPGGTKYTLQAP